jgi:biotin carboxyl carrier protein
MQKAIINGKEFEILASDTGLLVNGQPLSWDVLTVADGYFHILHNNKSYRAEVVKADAAAKTCTIKINGRFYPVEVKDKFDLLLEKMGMLKAGAGKLNYIKAPMPGLIVDLRVQEGATVKAGDPLLVLEAMKMENILKSPGEGTVKKIKIKKGDSVDKGQVLIEF